MQEELLCPRVGCLQHILVLHLDCLSSKFCPSASGWSSLISCCCHWCSVTLGYISPMSQLQGLSLAGHLLTRRTKVVPLCVWQRLSDSPEVPHLEVTQQPK